MDDLMRRFGRDHHPEIRKEIEELIPSSALDAPEHALQRLLHSAGQPFMPTGLYSGRT
jgi:hypothetical protein